MGFKRPVAGERGMALLLTLMITAILAAIAFQFNFITRVDHSMAASLWEETRAYYLAKSGYQFALAILADKPPGEEEIDHLGQRWARFKTPNSPSGITIEEGRITVTISDENAKININRLIQADGRSISQLHYRQMINLFELLGIDPVKIEPILDWLDSGPGDGRRPNGAEDGDYLQGSVGYPCKDGPMDDLSELAMVKGMKEEMAVDRGKGKRLGDFLTVAPTDGRININTADITVIRALSERIDPELANAIIERREELPFRSVSELKTVPGMEEKGRRRISLFDEIKDMITVRSGIFSIQASGRFHRASRKIIAMVRREKGTFQIISWSII